ncbi:hypothetical protein GCM10010497_33310 [Streptomyces cinereoruber]|uniref:DUF1015 domain-containing protein n=1 Tax=Streptomyces cinereoruber TaxID=67260 RepID=A0AAV4KJE5_9ACTN|nr:DUF1015 domain-containing protein [Streptomyces cinereoruber]MBB4159153.1 uncharacterized protein (DUF1015 family) [Streptomyces cinereoruber]MBY8817688.1 DUF1015 domain-containing protein [Streptomyces cinereoruber]NIH64387.1 uncharacterized protein (DUF1015 family) [Streptomyces cinereoruber]QEV32117.1 DUF1015 domain-containing protein [Streptomyces cinereoruber]GGR28422.1 hypothetical protein GCM10010497_33310 [Streptomyces cinereoruber]
MNTSGHAATDVRDDTAGLRLVPFRGLRYVPERVGSLAAVTSPPYDVVVRPDGLLHLESADPHNIVRLILPQAITAGTRHRKAAVTLDRWLADGVLAPDPVPALYVYEQRGDGILQRGIIGALELSAPEAGVVLPHEDVMPHVVEDRAALMRTTAANLEPLLLTYVGEEDGGGADAVIERATEREPLLSTTTEDGFCHRLWAVTDPAEQAAVAADLGRHQALIADGHHRWATYLRLREEHVAPGPWNYGLVLLVDTARHPLRVRAIHRLLNRLPVADALAAVEGSFRVRRLGGSLPEALEALASAAADGNAFLLAGDGAFHLLDRPDPALLDRTIRADRPEAWRTLDATVLHSTLLEHVWHVPDAPEDIAYIHDTEAAVDQAERRGGTAVLMHPVREEVVRDLARQGVTMPRKSTSFGPKPATGLVLRSLALD